MIVTDRDELDGQIYKTFATTKAEVQATCGAHLKQLLAEDHRYVFTLLQKLRTEPGGVHPQLSKRRDIIVITDKAHRSQYDIFALNLRSALPNAALLGFTGTPLIQGEEDRTREVFGDYVSVYDFSRSIEDGATVPLYYENCVPELQLTNDNLNEDLARRLEDAELDMEQEKKLVREFAREYHLINPRGPPGHRGGRRGAALSGPGLSRQGQDGVHRHPVPDTAANEFAPLAVLVAYLGAMNKALTPPADISEVMGDIEALLNDSIAIEGYRISATPKAESLLDLSMIDFEKLQQKFAQGRKRTEIQKLKGQIQQKLNDLVRLNHNRVDFQKKFQELIEAYNAGSRNLEDLFKALLAFTQQLTEEENRAQREDLTEEQLGDR